MSIYNILSYEPFISKPSISLDDTDKLLMIYGVMLKL